ncbi:ATP-dependent DNA helicase [Streptomyces sp. HSW2009]|uniref:ATP-dependent helicase n=1 Tax=Streptomyces sp. HSW2009 TaxID=3142890 RepID=UPI0032EB860C
MVRTPPGSATPPVLDARQRAVVDHAGGPLLVLAGPGTGKTTTLVEAVAARVRRGTDPERVLVLTFSRKAAVALRDRLAVRIGTVATPWATTFHSFCYALVRAHQDADLFTDPLRLLSGPEQDVVVRELLAGQTELEGAGRAAVRWPDELRACLTTRGFADEVRAVLARSRELGLGPQALGAFAARTGRPAWGAAADFLAEYLDVLDAQGVLDYAELVHRAVLLAERPEVAAELAGTYDAIYVDEYQDADVSQVRLLRALAGGLVARGAQGRAAGPSGRAPGAGPGAGSDVVSGPAFGATAAGAAADHLARVRARGSGSGDVEGAGSPGKVDGAAVGSAVGAGGAGADGAGRAADGDGTRGGGRDAVREGACGEGAYDGAYDSGVWGGGAQRGDARRGGAQHGDARHGDARGGGARGTQGTQGGGGRAGGGPGTALVVFGDPDQSIYAFRGADVGGILGFPAAFPRPDGRPADVAVLNTAHRARAGLLAATRTLAGRMPLSRLPAAVARAHRELTATRGGGRVEAYTYPTPSAELDNVADVLRRAHLTDGVPWNEMAVLVRAGARGLPGVRRALTTAGVPVEVDGDDIPLRHEPAVAPLLTALRAAATAALTPAGTARPGHHLPHQRAGAEPETASVGTETDTAAGTEPSAEAAPDAAGAGPQPAGWLSVETALTLLGSPLGGMDAADLRRLGRALRDEERAAGSPVPRPSDVLIAEALAEPERLVAHDPAYARGAQQLGLLLRTARETLAAGGTAEQALWCLWDGTTWPRRLENAAWRGGAAGRLADRDLDAVCALFETAARAEERTGGRGALNFLEELDAQDIAADTLARRAVRPDAVRLLTAHRAKGLQWRLVVVAGVQEGLWPDLRRRGSLLEADRIGRDGIAEPMPPGALLAEERRLFYVAATRARERLVVTAVRAPADDGDQPSRFLTELGVQPVDVLHRPRRPLSVPALVAELRVTTVDPQASVALRDAAAQRLAKLAALRDDEGHPLVPAAHPYRWWGLAETTRSAVPLRDRTAPVTLSGSALDQLVNTCSLQWFLGREVKAEPPSTAAQGFGNVVHVLADEVASGRTPADLAVLMERLDSVWDALAFDAPWKSRQEKENARAALERFLHWHVMERGGRTAVGSEHAFDVTLEVAEHRVRIRGSMDRVERDADGRAYVVDFKTGKQSVTRDAVAHHPQLAVYQLAVREGAVDDLFGGVRPEPGGAELVQLRQGAARKAGGETVPKVQAQEPLPPTPPDGAAADPDGAAADGTVGNTTGTAAGTATGSWVGDLLATAAGRVLDEYFPPTAGDHCNRCAFRASCGARPEGRHVVE